MDKLTIFLVIVTVILVLCVIGLFIMMGSVKGNHYKIVKTVQSNTDNLNKLYSANNTDAANIKRGPQGVQGVQGPEGRTGGVHAAAGPLMNVGEKKVATPTYGTGESAIVYLDEKQYTPVQYWTLKNNDNGSVSVVNKLTGNCLDTNNLGDVFSSPCNNNQSQQFMWSPNMQLSSLGQQNKCISMANYGRTAANSNNNYNLQTLQVQRGTNNGNVKRLQLDSCSSSFNPNQTWFVGN